MLMFLRQYATMMNRIMLVASFRIQALHLMHQYLHKCIQYQLRLCMLQVREEKEHWLLPDERIRLFFGDPR